ncbi:cation:H+ antiporter [Natranaerovirga pectinivora]|uniref:Cation:H+ antiporter n=2 Tax=Natranaerovirga pectinivora TaxID=682400 RepID=A0A4R3MPN8_9FIRM|nr:cation:H+ antiporter [Natranaerovirga pectinivora]
MIIKGSDWFVDATIWIAKVLRIPNIIIGATLVSLCTTLPEAMVSTSSALKGNPDIAFGNAIGSIACNTGLILAITIILTRPTLGDKKRIFGQGFFVLSLLGFITVTGMITGYISSLIGNLLLVLLGVYILYNVASSYKMKKKTPQREERVDVNGKLILQNAFLFIIGLVLTIWGANLLVENGEIIAKLLGIPDVIVGLTLTAFGTSLPELVTAITAVVKKAQDISIGNVLGANILNILLVIGVASSILPIPMQPDWISFHLPFVSLIVGLVVVYALMNQKRFNRWNGIVILSTYAVYLFFTISSTF